MKERGEREHHRAFRRLETDLEFRARVQPHESAKFSRILGSELHGKWLDDYAWEQHKMQRRIVDDVA